MKAVIVFLGLLALSQAAPSLSTWELFKAVHKKEYASRAEETLRKAIFEKNVAGIEEHNQKYEAGEATYKQGINQFTDMLNEEFVSLMNGYRSSDKVKSTSIFVASENTNDLPTNIDWREEGIVTPVKDQGSCGSCWAFSTTGSTEGQHALSTGTLVSLSEQQLVSCAGVRNGYTNLGCMGGVMDRAFNYIIDVGGIESEDDYPYVSGDGSNPSCLFDESLIAATLSNWVDVTPGDEAALQEAVATVGPVSVAIDASLASFHSYGGVGVYYDASCSSVTLDHGVLVVGYGVDTEDSILPREYWLVKNSWNSDWGDNGYIKMARNRDNNCGIATQPSYPVV